MKRTISLLICFGFTILGALVGYTASKIEVSYIKSIIENNEHKLSITEEKQAKCRDYLVMIREKGMDLYWKNLSN